VVAAVWVLIAFTATATAFSLFQVPYIALPAELADGYDQRTRLLTARVVVLTFAILLFGAGGQELRKLGGEDEHLGYLIMAFVAGLVIGGGMLISSFVAKKGPTSVAKPSSIADGYREGFSALKRSQPFRALLLTFGLQALATGIMLTGAVYVAKWVLNDESASSLLFVALIGPALIFTPVWQLVSRKIGKERGFVIASSFYGIAALALVGMLFAPGWWVFIPVALAGAGYAGMQSLPMSMLPDVITHDAARHGQGSAGTFGGMWTAGETTGMALGAAAFTFAIGIAGYIESTGADVVQPSSAVGAIAIAFSAVPAVLILLSLLSFSRYRLRKVDIDS
jgi:Na+/melibiose symporter-like transporter